MRRMMQSRPLLCRAAIQLSPNIQYATTLDSPDIEPAVRLTAAESSSATASIHKAGAASPSWPFKGSNTISSTSHSALLATGGTAKEWSSAAEKPSTPLCSACSFLEQQGHECPCIVLGSRQSIPVFMSINLCAEWIESVEKPNEMDRPEVTCAKTARKLCTAYNHLQ